MNSSGPPPLPVTKVRKQPRRNAGSDQPSSQSAGTLAAIGLGFIVSLVGGVSIVLIVTLGLLASGRISLPVSSTVAHAAGSGQLDSSHPSTGHVSSASNEEPSGAVGEAVSTDSETLSGQATEALGSSEESDSFSATKDEFSPAESDPLSPSVENEEAEQSAAESASSDSTDAKHLPATKTADSNSGAQIIQAMQEQPVLILPDLSSFKAYESKLLARLPDDPALAELDLKLLGIEEVFGDSVLAFVPQTVAGLKSWVVRLTDESIRESDRDIARFTLRKDGLYFQWSQASRNFETAELLSWCLLEVALQQHTCQRRLRKPMVREPVPIDILARNLNVPVFEDERNRPQLPLTEELKLDVSYGSDEKHTLELNELLILPVALRRQDDSEPALELEMIFEKIGDSLLLVSCECYGYPERALLDIEQTGPVLVDRAALADDHKSRARDRRDTEVRKNQKEKSIAQAKVMANKAVLAGNINLAKHWDAQRDSLETELDELERELKLISLADEWQERLLAESKRWKSSKKLDITLYFEIQGKPVEILTTAHD